MTARQGWVRARGSAVMAAVLALGLGLAACGSDDDGGGSSGGKITLKLATFGEFGYTDDMLKKFEAEHPGITVESSVAASSDDARTNMLTKLAANKGLADVEAVEISWVAQLRQYAERRV